MTQKNLARGYLPPWAMVHRWEALGISDTKQKEGQLPWNNLFDDRLYVYKSSQGEGIKGEHPLRG